jgi:hypothetical protein
MGTKHRTIAMSPEAVPRQRLYQLMQLPAPPQDFELLYGEALQNLRPLEPGEGASLIVQAEWAWSPMHNRVSNWEIGLDETKQHWVLWCSHHTDDCELADWCDPDDDEEDLQWVAIWHSQVVAACARGNLSERDASILLLLQAWTDERDSETELDRPHFYGAAGVLNIDELRSIERVVWE